MNREFLERQARRKAEHNPRPTILPNWSPAKTSKPEFPGECRGPALTGRLMEAIERRETYINPFNCEKLSAFDSHRLQEVPAMTREQIRDLALPLFTAKDFEPRLVRGYHVVLWTKSHGTFRYREIETFVRDKCHDQPWKITLNFKGLPAVATTQVMFWRVFDDQGRCLKRFEDYSVAMMSGDELRFAYTINF